MKSFDLQVAEYTNALVELINKSGMPLTVTKYVLTDILNATNTALTQRVQAESQQLTSDLEIKESEDVSDSIG